MKQKPPPVGRALLRVWKAALEKMHYYTHVCLHA